MLSCLVLSSGVERIGSPRRIVVDTELSVFRRESKKRGDFRRLVIF